MKYALKLLTCLLLAIACARQGPPAVGDSLVGEVHRTGPAGNSIPPDPGGGPDRDAMYARRWSGFTLFLGVVAGFGAVILLLVGFTVRSGSRDRDG